ncbi:MAG: hypothetical protein HQK60_13580 [Deltaproteobacteria bacterium]|nr:hypothetical protein [Deltaproteobacteria bacterium]
MNPSDLLYTIFSNNLWSQQEFDFAWVPNFNPKKGTAKVFPTGLFSNHQDDWNQVETYFKDPDNIFHPLLPHLPLMHYTIPGDTLKESIANDPYFGVYNIKWEGELRR